MHLTAERGWINDPHGVSFHHGRYHVFHQYVPGGTTWAARCHWGHAVSDDLLTWRPRPPALAPGDGDDGVWTGCLVEDGGRARILYTSVAGADHGLGRVRGATAVDDDWDSWVKDDAVVSPPEDLDLVAHRDPFVVREGRGWRMFTGAGGRDGVARALTWTSTDLVAWTYDGVAAERATGEMDPTWTGSLWECPQLVEVDGQHVLLVSVWQDDVLHHAAAALGSYADGRFTATTWARLTFGESYYAPSFFRDAEDRPCVLLWMRGVDGAGWAGCLSVPHLLGVVGGRLVATPHPAVAAARDPTGGKGGVAARDLAAGPVDAEWIPDPAGDRLAVRSGDADVARVVVDAGVVTLERTGAATWSMPWTGGPLRVLVDGPVLEVSGADGLLGGPIVPGEWLVPGRGAWSSWGLRPAPPGSERRR